jgi:hypothetical protein
MEVLVRNALFHRVQLMAFDKAGQLGDLDGQWGYPVHRWEDALDDLYEAHEEINIDAAARSRDFITIDRSDENSEHVWRVRQILDDVEGEHDWGIAGTVDLDATQDCGEVIFLDYRVGPMETLMEIARQGA